MDINKRSKWDIFDLSLGWTAVVGSIGLLIAISFAGIEIEHPSLLVRAAIVIPFTLIWGLRTIKKHKKERRREGL